MHWEKKFWLMFWLIFSLVAGIVLYSEFAFSHTGTLDQYGCHSNKALYGTTAKRECHIDLLAGQVFSSTTTEYQGYIAAQKTVINGLKTDLATCKANCPVVTPAPIVSVHGSDSTAIGLGEKPKPPPTITLIWKANTEPDLAGYNIYCGTAPRAYTLKKSVGMLTTGQFTNMLSKTYYCAVTAFDTSGNESLFSNEVSKVIQ